MGEVSNRTLNQGDPRIVVPTYDRTRLSVGVMHLGVGGFHRARQAVYLDQLMAEGKASNWALYGVGVLPQDRPHGGALAAQDRPYVVMLRELPTAFLENRALFSNLVDQPYAATLAVLQEARAGAALDRLLAAG